jgi:hypothetical protein
MPAWRGLQDHSMMPRFLGSSSAGSALGPDDATALDQGKIDVGFATVKAAARPPHSKSDAIEEERFA